MRLQPKKITEASKTDADLATSKELAVPKKEGDDMGATIKDRVDELLSKPMTRQQFLKHTGLAMLTLVGVTSVLNVFDPKKSGFNTTSSNQGPAYGTSVYAGGKRPQ